MIETVKAPVGDFRDWKAITIWAMPWPIHLRKRSGHLSPRPMKTKYQLSSVKNTNTAWRALYFAGGTAALIAVLVFRRYFGVELMQFKGFGLFNVPDVWPSSAIDWLVLFQENRFVGLALFDLFDLVNYALVGLIFLALYGVLRGVDKSVMLVATILSFVGIAVYFVSNQTFAMYSLSGHYAVAADEAERAMFLASGEALLAIHNPGVLYPGMGIFLSLFLLLLAGLIISIVMLRSEIFGKGTAVVGILANGCGLAFFAAFAFVPAYCWLFPTISAPFRLVWYLLIAIKLFQLGAGVTNKRRETGSI